MHLHRSGSGQCPTVVLIHGIPGAAASWSAVARQLEPDHDVVVPDLLGFGRSPRTGDLHAEAQATALLEALGGAGITRATFVGHDFGGPIVLSLYRRSPQMFDAVALMATNTFPDTHVPFPLSLVTLPVLGNAMSRALFSQPALRAMLWRFGGRQLGDAASVRSIFTRTLQQLPELFAEYPATLRSITVPATLVWGADDPFFPLPQAPATAELTAGSELVVLDGAGHFLPEQRPDEVAEAIRALVVRTRASRHDDAVR